MKETIEPPIVIGVAGGTGAGKTSVVESIRRRHADEAVAVLDLDSYYHDRSHLPAAERSRLNFDHPSAIDHELLLVHAQELRRGNSVEKPCYSFALHTRTPQTEHIDPAPILVIEGIHALYDARLRDLMDFKVFVHADPDVRFIRRLRRDIMKRGRSVNSVVEQYLKSVRPMHNEYIEPTREFADLTVDATQSVERAMEQIENAIATLRCARSRQSR